MTQLEGMCRRRGGRFQLTKNIQEINVEKCLQCVTFVVSTLVGMTFVSKVCVVLTSFLDLVKVALLTCPYYLAEKKLQHPLFLDGAVQFLAHCSLCLFCSSFFLHFHCYFFSSYPFDHEWLGDS